RLILNGSIFHQRFHTKWLTFIVAFIAGRAVALRSHGTTFPSKYFLTVFREMHSLVAICRWLTPSRCIRRTSLYISTVITTFIASIMPL
ncbi:MAG: hypothetical protein RSD23_08460, partial [Ruthenibacterium sp.]